MLIIGESRERIFRCLWYCFSQPFQALIGLREKIDSNNDNDILHSLQFMAYFHIYCESDRSGWGRGGLRWLRVGNLFPECEEVLWIGATEDGWRLVFKRTTWGGA